MHLTRRTFLRSAVGGLLACGGPAVAAAADAAAAATPSEPLDLFDGRTLAGWHAVPRVYVPNEPAFDKIPSAELRDAVYRHMEQVRRQPGRLKNTGRWSVADGAIVGGQVEGSNLGAYLLTDKTYGDFDLTFEARPDFPVDTGVMLRAHPLGSVGFQVLIDHRRQGCIGGIYGNSVGGFQAYPFVIDGDEQEDFRVANLRAGTPDGEILEPDKAADIKDFLKAWKPNDWNAFRVRCVGRLPVIETWINGTPIVTLDTARLGGRVPGYDPEAVLERIGRKGHIGLEVHDNGKMGRNRWAPGAVCRYRNLRITEL